MIQIMDGIIIYILYHRSDGGDLKKNKGSVGHKDVKRTWMQCPLYKKTSKAIRLRHRKILVIMAVWSFWKGNVLSGWEKAMDQYESKTEKSWAKLSRKINYVNSLRGYTWKKTLNIVYIFYLLRFFFVI